MTNYKKLEAWKKTMLVVKDVYLITKQYPKEELYALTSQTKRAAIAAPANIAEGIGRNYKKDTVQFLHIARGSLYELETHLCIAVMVEVIPAGKVEQLMANIDEAIKILNGLISYYEKSNLQ